MTQYDNTNRGSIWKNKKKREGKQDADFTGQLNVNGVEYWVNAWKRKEDASPDAPALSFSIRPKDEQPKQQSRESFKKSAVTARSLASNPPHDDMDDSIPFEPEFR